VIMKRDDGSQVKSCGSWFGPCRSGTNPFDDSRPLARGRWMDFDEWNEAFSKEYPPDVEGP